MIRAIPTLALAALGLAAGVRDVGKVLSEHFPRAEDDENELPDRLIEV